MLHHQLFFNHFQQVKFEHPLHQHRIPQVKRHLTFNENHANAFSNQGSFITSTTNDHDDEDFEEEPIKLWS